MNGERPPLTTIQLKGMPDGGPLSRPRVVTVKSPDPLLFALSPGTLGFPESDDRPL
jgi:hypothetical protein